MDLNFLFLMLTADFWECRGFCCFSSCHSSAVLWYPTFCTSFQPPRFNNEWNASAEICLSLYYFQGLCLFVLDIGGCAFFSLFNIWLSYLLLLRIPFGVLLLSIARQLIHIDHTVGLPLPHRETPATPQAPPWPGTPPHCRTTSLFTWMKIFTWNTDDTTKDRGRKITVMRSRVVGRGSTRQEINSPQIFN